MRQFVLRKQKVALLKAKQQQVKRATAPMVVPVEGVQPKAGSCAPKGQEPNVDSSDESEYSSLEDDDDAQGIPSTCANLFITFFCANFLRTDSDDSDGNNSFTDSEESYHAEGKVAPQLVNGIALNGDRLSSEHFFMLADSVEGSYPKTGPLAPSLFPNVPPYITFVTYEEKGPAMPPAVNKVLKWKLTTITPIVIRKVLLNSGFRLLKRKCTTMSPLLHSSAVERARIFSIHRDKRLDGRVGKTYEKSMLPHTSSISEDKPCSGQFPNRPQRPDLAESADSDVASRQERVQLHAAHLHSASGPEAIQARLAALRAEEHEVDHQAAGVGTRNRNQSGEPMDPNLEEKTADCAEVSANDFVRCMRIADLERRWPRYFYPQ